MIHLHSPNWGQFVSLTLAEIVLVLLVAGVTILGYLLGGRLYR